MHHRFGSIRAENITHGGNADVQIVIGLQIHLVGKIAPEIGAGIQQDYRTVIQSANGQICKSFRTAQGVPGKSPQQIFIAGVADVDDEAFIFFDHRTDGPSMVQANAGASGGLV